jgi:hypothetical protein
MTEVIVTHFQIESGKAVLYGRGRDSGYGVSLCQAYDASPAYLYVAANSFENTSEDESEILRDLHQIYFPTNIVSIDKRNFVLFAPQSYQNLIPLETHHMTLYLRLYSRHLAAHLINSGRVDDCRNLNISMEINPKRIIFWGIIWDPYENRLVGGYMSYLTDYNQIKNKESTNDIQIFIFTEPVQFAYELCQLYNSAALTITTSHAAEKLEILQNILTASSLVGASRFNRNICTIELMDILAFAHSSLNKNCPYLVEKNFKSGYYTMNRNYFPKMSASRENYFNADHMGSYWYNDFVYINGLPSSFDISLTSKEIIPYYESICRVCMIILMHYVSDAIPVTKTFHIPLADVLTKDTTREINEFLLINNFRCPDFFSLKFKYEAEFAKQYMSTFTFDNFEYMAPAVKTLLEEENAEIEESNLRDRNKALKHISIFDSVDFIHHVISVYYPYLTGGSGAQNSATQYTTATMFGYCWYDVLIAFKPLVVRFLFKMISMFKFEYVQYIKYGVAIVNEIPTYSSIPKIITIGTQSESKLVIRQDGWFYVTSYDSPSSMTRYGSGPAALLILTFDDEYRRTLNEMVDTRVMHDRIVIDRHSFRAYSYLLDTGDVVINQFCAKYKLPFVIHVSYNEERKELVREKPRRIR